VTDPGYYLDGDKVETCVAVLDSSARTCNGAGASGIQTVACDRGFHELGSAGVDLGCTTCDNQANCATSTPNTCSPTVGILTKTPCTLVTDPGYYLDGDKVETCVAVLNSSARTCNGAGAGGIQTVTCDPGFHESGSAGVDLGCTACATVSGSSARTCNGAGASGIQTVTCDPGFHESGSAGVDLGCTACATVSGSSARTCNGAGAVDIQTVTCTTGFLKIGSAGNNNLTCIADTDNDGIPDSHEIGSDPNIPVDTDNDGTPDYLELDR
jgi:hypothetical protein